MYTSTYSVKSRTVDWSTIQFWTICHFVQRSQYIRIKIPLHKQSENPWMCYYQRQSAACDFNTVSITSLYCTCYKSLVPTIENLGAPSKSIVEASLSKENGQIVIQTVLLKVNHACQTI